MNTQEQHAGADPVHQTVSRPTAKDFSRWVPNVEVAIWGRGMATAEKRDCPMASPPGAKYPGDCQDCEMFMGVRFPERMTETPSCGDRFKACCWAKVANARVQPGTQAQPE